MALPYTSILAGASGQSTSGYSIPYSARFVSGNSAYLTRTPGVAGNKQTFTISTWFKFGTLPSTAERRVLFSANSANPYFRIEFDDTTVTGALMVYQYNGAGYDFQLLTTQVFRDPGAWYHVVVAFDTTQGTAANRIKVYINGAQITAFGTANYPSASLNTYWNATNAMRIGRGFGTDRFDGYLANTTGVDGSQLTPSSFGQTNTNGVWVPKAYAGTYGTNGFLMAFANSAALGTDTSGNGNTFTSSGLTSADQFSDTPTNNYATWNPLAIAGTTLLTLSNGNLTSALTNDAYCAATIGIPYGSGKFYWEMTCTTKGGAGGAMMAGIVNGQAVPATGTTAPTSAGQGNSEIAYVANGNKSIGGTTSAYGATYTNGDVIGVAYDATVGSITFYKNNSTQGVASTGITGTQYPMCYTYSLATTNFGATAFTYTPPTGFVALNTSNLPAAAIKDGSAHFQSTTYTGTGSSLAVNQSGNSTFTPGLVWAKSRSAATDHALYDVLRGAQARL